jgi:hypothetical protein
VDYVSNVPLDCENRGDVTNCERRAPSQRIGRAPWWLTIIGGSMRAFMPASVMVLAKSGCQPKSWERATPGAARMARSLLDKGDSANGLSPGERSERPVKQIVRPPAVCVYDKPVVAKGGCVWCHIVGGR